MATIFRLRRRRLPHAELARQYSGFSVGTHVIPVGAKGAGEVSLVAH